MDCYIYQAELVCEDCGKRIRHALTIAGEAPTDPDEERSYDSDKFPKGPYANGGGEADSPQCCGSCGVFLENPLTTDGEDYVREARKSDRLPVSWKERYAYLWQ